MLLFTSTRGESKVLINLNRAHSKRSEDTKVLNRFKLGFLSHGLVILVGVKESKKYRKHFSEMLLNILQWQTQPSDIFLKIYVLKILKFFQRTTRVSFTSLLFQSESALL